MRFVSGTSTSSFWTGSLRFDTNDLTGRYYLDCEGVPNELGGDAVFHVKRNTMMPSFNASPEPVRKDSPVRVAGRLTRLTSNANYVGYSGKTISLYFKPVGGTWTLKGTATTDSNGYWSRSFTASVDGEWQARFAGTSNYHRETSRSDYVDVQ